MLLVLSGSLSGCANLRKSVEQRVAISEQCRAATSLAPLAYQSPGPLASIQLGNIGYCSLSKENLLPMCSLDQIITHYEIKADVPASGTTPTKADARAATQAELVKFNTAVALLRNELHALAIAINKLRLDDNFSKVAETVVPSNYDKRSSLLEKWLTETETETATLKERIDAVRIAQKNLRERMRALGPVLDAQAQVELAAWDANLRFQLSRLEQVLGGDYTVVIQEGIKDQVLTHVARRTLDLMHGSLKAPDVVIRQLDDKAYGAVSISYLAFGPQLQDAVDKAFRNIEASYRKRMLEKEKAEKKKAERLGVKPPDPATDQKTHQAALGSDTDTLTRPLLRELRRAACGNLLQGTEFSMLTELVDTMIIRHVEQKDPEPDPPVGEVTASIPVGVPDASVPQGNPAGSTLAASAPTELAPFSVWDSSVMVAAAQPDTLAPRSAPPAEVTPAGVHMTHAWVARQQMLVQAIQAKLGGAGKAAGFPGIETVDESAVQRLADAATAKVIDDAVRLDPALLGAGPTGVSVQVRNNVNVVTAATAVSQAAAVLKVNLSVSNVNTFNPTNNNHITPVINLNVPPQPVAPPVTSAIPSLCVEPGFGREGVLCSQDGNALVLSFTRATFKADSCLASDLGPALTAVGRRIAAYRARHGVEFDATVEGYASLPPARLAMCEAARTPRTACRYANHARDGVEVKACAENSSDRNVVLSAARARNAARALEAAGQGAVTVDTLVARGTETAQLRGGPESDDQTVVIRLRPRAR